MARQLSLCGVAIPNGFTADGLPASLQVPGHAGAETTALRIAFAYEQATEWMSRKPPES